MTLLKTTAAAAALMISAGAASAVTVDLVPSTTGPIAVGDTVSFALTTSADFPEFLGFDADITYDASVLSFQGISYSSEFDITPTAANTPTEPAGASGVITLGLFTAGRLFGDQPSGMVEAAVFEFLAVANGSTAVTVDRFDGSGDFFLNADGVSVFDGVASTSITVGQGPDTPVIPLPASALLLLGGVATLPILRRGKGRA